MSTPTVRMLADDPGLGLRLLTGAASAGGEVAGAHTTDLDHPARYLLPGELVLTNGLWTEHVDGAAWAAEVATAGAAAIGFGLADHHPEVPGGLLTACEELGLPLLEVPEDLSFSMIVAAAADDTGVRLQLSRTRRLLQRLGAGGGHAALLDFLRQRDLASTCGWSGRAACRSASAAPDAELARSAARAARRGELPAAIGDDACAFGAAPVLAARTAVLVGAPLGDIGDDAPAGHRAGHRLRRARGRAGTRGGGGAADAGHGSSSSWPGAATSPPRCSLRECGRSALPGRPVHRGGLGERSARRDVRRARAAATPPSPPGTATPSSCSSSPAPTTSPTGLAGLIADGGDDQTLGAGRPIADPADPAALRQSLAEAITALALARTRPAGQRVVRHLDIGSHALLLDFVDRQVLLSFRESVLGPLQRWDRDHGAQARCARCRRSWPTTGSGA